MAYQFNPFTGKLDITLSPAEKIIIDTKANILASTPTASYMGFSSDTLEVFIANGSVWEMSPFRLLPESANPDMGYLQNSSRIGYNPTYITDKDISNSRLLEFSGTPTSGAMRTTTAGIMQVYLNGVWNNVVINFVFREDGSFGYALEHMPIGFTNYIELMTGQSLGNLGMNGLPIINAYKVSMGAYPVCATIGGRTI